MAAQAPRSSVKRGGTAPLSAAAGPRPEALPGVVAAALPRFVPPLLATAASAPPRGARWVHEIKLDGYRMQARLEGGRARFLSRSGLDWSERMGPALAAAVAALPAATALIDGEVVVAAESGAASFAELQADLGAGRTDRLALWAFDLIHLDGYDLRAAPLSARKEVLRRLVAGAAVPLHLSEHFEEDGAVVFRHACALGLEGVLSKRRDSPYRSGRSSSWIKVKCTEQMAFVVCGFVPRADAAAAIGSLVLGYYEGERLIHAGRVGSGFSAALAAELYGRLAPQQLKRSPFDRPLAPIWAKGVRYVKPELVVEVECRGWTADDVLRHASFRTLRADRAPRDVRRAGPGGS